MTTSEFTEKQDYDTSDFEKMVFRTRGSLSPCVLQKYLSRIPDYLNSFQMGNTYFFMIDFSKMHYAYISPSIEEVLGYDVDVWMKKGISFAFEIFHPDDVAVLREVHQKIMEKFYSFSIEDRLKFRFAHDFRFVRSDGSVARIFQQTVFLELDEKGNPLLDLCICTDISGQKTDNRINLNISHFDKTKGYIGFSQDFSFDPNFNLTNREIEILKMISRGLSSKMIAHELGLSEETVKTHRKNMIKKSNCQTIHEVLTKAIINGLLAL